MKCLPQVLEGFHLYFYNLPDGYKQFGIKRVPLTQTVLNEFGAITLHCITLHCRQCSYAQQSVG